MAEAVHESSFWLPSDFLSDDDFFFPPNLTLPHPSANSSFPPFIPPPPPPSAGSPPLFRRSSSALTSPGESVVSSTETETSADDPDEFIADLTRHLALSALRDRASKPLPHHHSHSQEKAWSALATSPQSTLSGFASWTNRRRTPPASDDEAWELIYAAAERIAKMRMSCQAQLLKQRLSQMEEARTPPVCYNAPLNHHHHHHQFQQVSATGRCGALPHSFPQLRAEQHAPRHHHHHGGPAVRAVYLGGTTAAAAAPVGIKKPSTGTGVFLPRRVGTTTTNSNSAPAEPRKKQGGCSTVLVPARVVQALNLLNNRDEDHPHPHTHTHPLNHDMLVARRNGAIMGQQQRRGLRGEPLLPQEWTY